MTTIVKKFEIYVSQGNLGLFLGESTLLLKKGALLPWELGPFPKENSLLLGEVVFFTRNFFSSMRNLFGTGS
jgi:hypothetical protein